MHEASLIKFTLDSVEKKATEMSMEKVNLIHLTCGKMRGAIPILMETSFKILTSQRPMFRDSVLEICEPETVVRCAKCNRESHIEDFSEVRCGACGSGEYIVISGNELKIDYFEGE